MSLNQTSLSITLDVQLILLSCIALQTAGLRQTIEVDVLRKSGKKVESE